MSGFFTRTNRDMKYIFKSSSKLNKKQLKRKKRGISSLIGILLVIVELIISILFTYEIIKLNIFPLKYLAMFIIVIILLLLYNFTSQFTKSRGIGKFLSILVSMLLVFGYLVGSKVNWTLQGITSNITKTDSIHLVVLKEDTASSIADTLNYTYGYNSQHDGDLPVKAIDKINQENNSSLNVKTYENWEQITNALYENNDIQLIAINSNIYKTLLEEDEDFGGKTRILDTITITTKVAIEKGEIKQKDDCFIMYISGNDDYGTISDTGRSDVNILAVINPETRQVMLISTPRDYYINISRPDSSGKIITGLDKLTHAGNAGTKYSMEALSNLFGVDVDYFFKVNFDGCVNIIDALGGITIFSDVDFINGTDAAPERYHFVKGSNECDGAKALAFVREREAFAAGDLQRGKNQQAAISAMIEKATSPAILTNYSAILDAVSDMMYTNMPTESIQQLIKDQLSDATPWNVQSYSLTFMPEVNYIKPLHVYGGTGWACLPDYDSVNMAIKLIQKTQNDEIFNVDEVIQEIENLENSDNTSVTN